MRMHMRASLILALAVAGLFCVSCSMADSSEEQSRQLSARLKENQEIRDEAAARVAHIPEPRRTAELLNVEQAIRLNRQGQVCANVLTASSLPGTHDITVTCQVALFRDETVSYRIEAETGRATRL
jgi:hypothetical protein